MRSGGSLTALVLAVMVMTAGAAHALDLTGAEVDGSFFVNGGSTNFFDTSTGKVPAGFGNSGNAAGDTTVVISDSVVEFAYQGGSALFTVDFTTTGGFTVATTGGVPFTTVGLGFTSPSFVPGLTLTFVGGPGGCAFLGGITCSFNGPTTAPFTTTFNIEAVPAPASLILLGLGLVGVAVRSRKRA